MIPEAEDLGRNISCREADFKNETKLGTQVLLLNKSNAVQPFKPSLIFPRAVSKAVEKGLRISQTSFSETTAFLCRWHTILSQGEASHIKWQHLSAAKQAKKIKILWENVGS